MEIYALITHYLTFIMCLPQKLQKPLYTNNYALKSTYYVVVSIIFVKITKIVDLITLLSFLVGSKAIKFSSFLKTYYTRNENI